MIQKHSSPILTPAFAGPCCHWGRRALGPTPLSSLPAPERWTRGPCSSSSRPSRNGWNRSSRRRAKSLVGSEEKFREKNFCIGVGSVKRWLKLNVYSRLLENYSGCRIILSRQCEF